jgi:hypothetical protein
VGYDNMTNAGAWTWVRPATLIKSQCSPNFNSVLDFIFVNAATQGWSGTSEILVVPNDCDPFPDTSDHRPVLGTFNMGGDAGPRLTKEQLLRKIEEIERQLIQLKEAVRRLPKSKVLWGVARATAKHGGEVLWISLRPLTPGTLTGMRDCFSRDYDGIQACVTG